MKWRPTWEGRYPVTFRLQEVNVQNTLRPISLGKWSNDGGPINSHLENEDYPMCVTMIFMFKNILLGSKSPKKKKKGNFFFL